MGLALELWLRGLWLVRQPPQFRLLPPSLSPPWLVHPREFSRSVGALPPLPYLFMAHTCCLPRRVCERRSFFWLETSLMGVCESEVFLGLSARPDGFEAVVPHGLFSVFS